jgi:ATP-dependent RNA helicase RhlE
MELAAPLKRAVEAVGYETATPIQARAIPIVLSGADLLGCAQTGTGKTAAYTLPMLGRLLTSTADAATPAAERPLPAKHRSGDKRDRRWDGRPIRALVLSPTRELAAQIGESLGRYGRFTSLRHTVVYGGVSQFHQVKDLQKGVDTLVATPGRLMDLHEQGHIDLSKIEVLILDEADQMMDMGFLPALKHIVSLVPRERQTLMFSATMPAEIRKLAGQWLTNPQSIEIAPVATPADRIRQTVHLVDNKRKADLLSKFLQDTPRGRTLVFSRTKRGADVIVKRLQKDGHRAAAIHGNKSQGARSKALAQFKSKNPPVLVATDIAARGLDIDNISHVVNYDLPEVAETYVHRIGRTARAGADGVAVSFCAGHERSLLRQIERVIKMAIDVEGTIDGFECTDPVVNAKPQRRGGGGGNRGPGGGGQGGPRRNFASKGAAKKKTFGNADPRGSSGKGSNGGLRNRRRNAASKPRSAGT